MKKLIYLILLSITVIACNQEQRYFAESNETNTLKEGIAAYEAGDWDTWVTHFADTAKIYVNSSEPMNVSERVASLKEMSGAMSSYGFDHDEAHIEMVVDKNDETWVYFWGLHNGTIAAGSYARQDGGAYVVLEEGDTIVMQDEAGSSFSTICTFELFKKEGV